MLCDKRLGIGCSTLKSGQIDWISNISQCDTNVTQEAASLNPFNRRISKKQTELIIAQSEIITQRHPRSRGTRRKRRLARYLCKTIPRTGIKTIVAAKNSVSDECSKLQWDRTFEFDCQIGNAQARIQAMRCGDGTGGTGLDTTLTSSTAICYGPIPW